MPTPVMRDATIADCAPLAGFWRDRFVETFAHLYRPDDLAAFLAASYSPAQQMAEILAAGVEHRLSVDGLSVLGACQIGPLGLPIDPGPAKSIELKRLYLVEAAKGQGIGQQLMDWAIERAVARGASRIYLGVWRHNERAQRFYARNGFAKVGEYFFPVGSALDEEDILLRML